MKVPLKSIQCSVPFNYNSRYAEDWFKHYFSKDYWDLVEFSCSTIEVTEGELEFILPLLEEVNCQNIIDLCCGIGRHSIRLAEKGYNVTAIDIDNYAIDTINKTAGIHFDNLEVIHGDVRDINYQGDYDAALLMQTSFGYFSDDENLALLQKINISLRDKGLLIIDIPNRDGMVKNFRSRDWTSIEEKFYCISHQFDYFNSRRNTTMKVIENEETREYYHSIRMYTISEVTQLLELSGFEIISYFGDFVDEGIRFSNEHRRLQIIAQKQS